MAIIIDIPRTPCWIKKGPKKMATMVAKITQSSQLEYRRIPHFLLDSNGGRGGQKKVNNYGHDRYFILG